MIEPIPRRAICMRQTDENFFLAVKRPLSPYEGDYHRLQSLAHSVVRYLDEGSQVFVYAREEFNPGEGLGAFTDVSAFKDEVEMVTKNFRTRVVVDPCIERVEDRIEPFSQVG